MSILLEMKVHIDLKKQEVWPLICHLVFCMFLILKKKLLITQKLLKFLDNLDQYNHWSNKLFIQLLYFLRYILVLISKISYNIIRFLVQENYKYMCLVRFSKLEESVTALANLHG